MTQANRVALMTLVWLVPLLSCSDGPALQSADQPRAGSAAGGAAAGIAAGSAEAGRSASAGGSTASGTTPRGQAGSDQQTDAGAPMAGAAGAIVGGCPLSIVDVDGGLEIRRDDLNRALSFQHLQSNRRPFQHPLKTPDGQGEITAWDSDYSGGDSHQTGLFFAFTGLNGRDYFHHKPSRECWEGCFSNTAAAVVRRAGNPVAWDVTTQWLASDGTTVVLEETQSYELTCFADRYRLDLRWSGLAATDVTIAEAAYGGLFLRSLRPPDKAVVNAAADLNRAGDGQRSEWIEVKLTAASSEPSAQVAVVVMDHPNNPRYPTAWRVDEALQVGAVPSAPAAGGEIDVPMGSKLVLHYRLLVAAALDEATRASEWQAFAAE